MRYSNAQIGYPVLMISGCGMLLHLSDMRCMVSRFVVNFMQFFIITDKRGGAFTSGR